MADLEHRVVMTKPMRNSSSSSNTNTTITNNNRDKREGISER